MDSKKYLGETCMICGETLMAEDSNGNKFHIDLPICENCYEKSKDENWYYNKEKNEWEFKGE